MRGFGLTEYEATIYFALSRDFQESAASASEISEVSGIPYTKVYSVLSSLSKKGLVEVMRGKPALYKLVDPQASFGRLKQDKIADVSRAYEQVISSVKDLFSTGSKKGGKQNGEQHGASWNIQGKKNVINKLSEQVHGARKSLKLVFPNLNYFDKTILCQIFSRSSRIHTNLIVTSKDHKFLKDVPNVDVRYNESIRSRYALFDDKYSLMIAMETPDYWTGVFETCGNCTRQAYEHFDLVWNASRTFPA